MTDTDPNSLEHRIDHTRSVVWMVLSAIMAVELHTLDPGAEPAVYALVLTIGVLSYTVFTLLTVKTSRWGLPVLRAVGKPEWSYYYEPPEEAL